MEKQRLKYAEFLAEQKKNAKNEAGTLAWIIERVINDVLANPEMKQFGRTKLGRLRMLQRSELGSKMAAKLTKQDYIEHIKARRKEVGPATANHDVGAIATTLAHYLATWSEPNIDEAWKALGIAKIFLARNNLTGKANRRTRRPTDEEIAVILQECREHDARQRSRYKCYTDFVLFGLGSARRRGEVARITWGDVDFEQKVYWVRDMKHPTKKKGNDKRFILWPSLEEIIRRQPRVGSEPSERIFPVNANSLGAFYCEIKNKHGITDLRLHDNRGDCLSRFLLKYPPEDVRLMVSGHDDTKILEKVYDRRDALEVAKAKLPEFQKVTAA